MSQYRVFQNGKRCNDYNIKNWDNDTFSTLEEAIFYAHYWALPLPYKNLKQAAEQGQLTQMEIGKTYDLSYTHESVMMHIEIVQE